MDLEKHRNKNGTINGVSALSEFTGLPQDDIKSMFHDAQENNRKLESCPYHEFSPNPELAGDHMRPVNRHNAYMCIHCKGTVTPTMYRWHEIGRRPKP